MNAINGGMYNEYKKELFIQISKSNIFEIYKLYAAYEIGHLPYFHKYFKILFERTDSLYNTFPILHRKLSTY